jgi:2-polyprenyl-3-methyl-5-hydroxy-6-metoxy-1,4-benzoquinol methylase
MSAMTHDPLPPRERFTGYYAAPRAPWDIGRPQRAFVEAGDQIRGRVIDIGCGTGDLALWLAGRGCTVTGVDFLDTPLAAARRKAGEHGLSVTFLQMDALAVGEIPERFDAVTDCGLFHTFDDVGRSAYVGALARLLEPGSRVFLLCFADAEPGTHGPRRVSERELREAFARGWQVEKIEPSRFEVVPGIPGAEFGPGGAKAWFAVIRRA